MSLGTSFAHIRANYKLKKGEKMKMKENRIIALVILVAGLGVLSGSFNAWAEEEKPTASADAAFLSRYVWRGYALSDDSFVIQPSATLGYKGFGLNLWGNLDTDFDDGDSTTSDKTEWTETDLTLSYDTNFGPVGLGLGYIYYALDGTDDSQEFYVSIGLDTLLSPTLTIYREVAHFPGWYVNFGVSHSIDLSKKMSLDLGGSVGYYSYEDDDFVEVKDPTENYRNFHDGQLSATLTVPIGGYFTFSPMIAYSFPLSDEADDFIPTQSLSGVGNDSDFLFGGLTVAISF